MGNKIKEKYLNNNNLCNLVHCSRYLVDNTSILIFNKYNHYRCISPLYPDGYCYQVYRMRYRLTSSSFTDYILATTVLEKVEEKCLTK